MNEGRFTLVIVVSSYVNVEQPEPRVIGSLSLSSIGSYPRLLKSFYIFFLPIIQNNYVEFFGLMK